MKPPVQDFSDPSCHATETDLKPAAADQRRGGGDVFVREKLSCPEIELDLCYAVALLFGFIVQLVSFPCNGDQGINVFVYLYKWCHWQHYVWGFK